MARSSATLMIDIAADVAKLRTGFEQAEKMVGSFGSKMANLAKTVGAGLAGGAALGAAMARFAAIRADIDRMSDTAENLKLPLDDFQALEGAALLAGQSIEKVGDSVGKFNVFMGKASEGNKDQVELLNDLGVKALDASGKMRPLNVLLSETATAVSKIEDPFRRAKTEVELFGRSGQSISALLPQWAKGTTALNKELEALGLVHSPAVKKALAEQADAIDVASKRFDVLFAKVATPVSVAALDIINAVLKDMAATLDKVNAGANPNVIGLTRALNLNKQKLAENQQQLDDLMSGSGPVDAGRLNKLNAEAERLRLNLITVEENLRRIQRPDRPPTPTTPPGGNQSLGVVDKNAGEKIAAIMNKVREEASKANDAVGVLQDKMSAGLDDTEAARRNEAMANVAARIREVSQEFKNAKLSPSTEQLNDVAKWLKSTAEATLQQEHLKDVLKAGEAAHAEFGNGVAIAREQMNLLKEALDLNLITSDEYAAAIRKVKEAQEDQQASADRMKTGLEGIGAGFQFAMMKANRASSEFEMGEQIFTNLFSGMRDAIKDLVKTGQVDFAKLAESFAAMLAEMAAQLAAKAALNLIMSAIGGGLGSVFGSGVNEVPGFSGSKFDPPTPNLRFGGPRAGGGPVSPMASYIVGENGPERFVPNVAGRIDPNPGMAGSITINNNAPGVEVQTQRTSGGDLLFIIEKVRDAMTRDVRRGGNPFSVSLGQAYGVARAGR